MKEREKRKPKNTRVMLKDGEQSFTGTIINFSKTGMSIKTDHAFPTYKVIDIGIKIGEKLIPLKGSVRWVSQASCSPAEPQEERVRLGISLRNPPLEYLKHFE